MSPSGTHRAKIIAPIAVLLAAGVLVVAMVSLRPDTASQRPERVPPIVSVQTAQPETVRLAVTAQGTVEPRTESDLVTEVAGRIVWVSPQLASGGFFGEGEPLLRMDARDHEIALDGARAALQRARSNLSHAKRTLERQRSIRQTGASSQARLDEAIFNFETAEANLREAKVAVERAELDLERTEIDAPFAGRVLEKRVDVGQFVARGVPVARIYSVDFAEVRLPIDDMDLAFLALDVRPRVAREGEAPRRLANVTLRAEYAGGEHQWQGYVVRTEGALDARTRMITLVARVDDPYALEEGAGASEANDAPRAPLPIGLFVHAEIEGREVSEVVSVPPGALRRGREVLVIDTDDRLRVRDVDVLRVERERTLIRGGVAAGERIVTSPLEVATEGMAVRPIERPAANTAARPEDLFSRSGRWAS